MVITRDVIVGSRITAVHRVFRTEDGLDYSEQYFTSDRGFSFRLPCAETQWAAEPLPEGAEQLDDRITINSFLVRKGWFGLQRFVREADRVDDTIYRIKQAIISRVLCGPFDPELGFYCPEDTTIVMDDGSRLTCNAVAPHGTGAAGLSYLPPDKEKVERMTDYFSIPVAS